MIAAWRALFALALAPFTVQAASCSNPYGGEVIPSARAQNEFTECYEFLCDYLGFLSCQSNPPRIMENYDADLKQPDPRLP